MASALIARLEGFASAKLAYKGTADKKAALVAYLDSVIERRLTDAPDR